IDLLTARREGKNGEWSSALTHALFHPQNPRPSAWATRRVSPTWIIKRRTQDGFLSAQVIYGQERPHTRTLLREITLNRASQDFGGWMIYFTYRLYAKDNRHDKAKKNPSLVPLSLSTKIPMMMLLVIFHTCICALSCCSNLFLLYLIIFNTPQQLKSYATMLITQCIYELITSISTLIVFPRIVPLGFEGIVRVYSGPCVYLDSDYTCFLIFTLVLVGFIMYNIQMTANFCFRYYVLKRTNPDVWRVILLNILLLSPAILSACCFLHALSPESQVRELIRRETPQYDFSQNRLFGLTDLTHSWALPSIFLDVLTAIPCTLVNVLVGSAVSRFLRDNSSYFSTKTRATHDMFLKVLTFQAAISQAFLIATACYVVGQLNIVRSPLQEYATYMIGDFLLVFSPLLTMYYVPPYRSHHVDRLRYLWPREKLRPDEAEKRMRERKDILPAQRMTFDQIRNRIATLLSQKKEHQRKEHGNRQRRYVKLIDDFERDLAEEGMSLDDIEEEVDLERPLDEDDLIITSDEIYDLVHSNMEFFDNPSEPRTIYLGCCVELAITDVYTCILALATGVWRILVRQLGQPDEYRPLGSSRGGLRTDSNLIYGQEKPHSRRLLREFTLNHASQDFGGWMIYFWTQAID
uniref:G protein-coupled receptor n=1 Tax=Pristionchus pacificus TaxID=54126 RepID=A0A8R1YC94_PRIPA